MTLERKHTLVRLVTGGILGLLAISLLGGLLNGLLERPPLRIFYLISPALTRRTGSPAAALAIQSVFFFALGGAAGIATLPFADTGSQVVFRSLGHFGVTAWLFSTTVWLCGWTGGDWLLWLDELILLAVVYAVIWLGRWVGWYFEAAAIRDRLGLPPGPSLFHWVECLPYLTFALGLCVGLPFLFRLIEYQGGMPVLTWFLMPFILLPIGGFFSGLSLGRRHGVCPLYPAACGAMYLPIIFWLLNHTALYHCGIAFFSPLLGNLAGAACTRNRRIQKGDK